MTDCTIEQWHEDADAAWTQAADDQWSLLLARTRFAPLCEPPPPAPPPPPPRAIKPTTSPPGETAKQFAEVRWEGALGFEGQRTGDGRLIEVGALRWPELPLPLRYVAADWGKHDGAASVGTIETIERRATDDPNVRVIWGTGVIDTSDEVGRRAARGIHKRKQDGVSMDLDEVTFDVQHAQGDHLAVTEDGRIRGATIVSIAAFADAKLSLITRGQQRTRRAAKPARPVLTGLAATIAAGIDRASRKAAKSRALRARASEALAANGGNELAAFAALQFMPRGLSLPEWSAACREQAQLERDTLADELAERVWEMVAND